jgi:hypothetical protein
MRFRSKLLLLELRTGADGLWQRVFNNLAYKLESSLRFRCLVDYR